MGETWDTRGGAKQRSKHKLVQLKHVRHNACRQNDCLQSTACPLVLVTLVLVAERWRKNWL